MPAFTRDQVQAIDVGTLLARGFDGVRFAPAEPVTSVFARGVNVMGKAYVCFYCRFGENASMSGSIAEGDELDGRMYRLVKGPASA